MSTDKQTWWAIKSRTGKILTTDFPPGASESHVNVPWLFATRKAAQRYVEEDLGDRVVQVIVREIEDAA